LYSFPYALVGSGCTQCNNFARSDATPKWAIFETYLAILENCTVSCAPAGAVVATDTASANVDQYNGAAV
jgi:hypothetical protein